VPNDGCAEALRKISEKVRFPRIVHRTVMNGTMRLAGYFRSSVYLWRKRECKEKREYEEKTCEELFSCVSCGEAIVKQ